MAQAKDSSGFFDSFTNSSLYKDFVVPLGQQKLGIDNNKTKTDATKKAYQDIQQKQDYQFKALGMQIDKKMMIYAGLGVVALVILKRL